MKIKYEDLLSAHEKKDYDRMLADVGQIHQLVNEYNDSNAYEAIANRGKSGR